MPLITPLYAALLGLLLVYLALRIVNHRRSMRVSYGMGEDERLARAIRAHGNLIEYAPLTLMLVFFVESLGGWSWFVHALGLTLLLGRCLHAHGMSSVPEKSNLHVLGMVLTFTSLITASLTIVGFWIIRLF